ncbi:hypothetical protein [Hymenobacter norwichensis]|uniref:hypothetical protein n=1 Tax=Hymenobacter norwichensis TaxID=223903 RepID=UPI0003B790E6|nr:hypothetical protein [Hymenobacter norwichensis]
MKTLLFSLFLLFETPSSAQHTPYAFSLLPLDAATNRVVYTDKVAAAGLSEQELLTRVQELSERLPKGYRATNYRTNTAAGTASAQVAVKDGQEAYNFLLSLNVAEGAYTYQLHNLTYTRSDNARAGKYSTGPFTTGIETVVYTRPSKYRAKKLAQVDTHMRRFISVLNDTLLRESAEVATQ